MPLSEYLAHDLVVPEDENFFGRFESFEQAASQISDLDERDHLDLIYRLCEPPSARIFFAQYSIRKLFKGAVVDGFARVETTEEYLPSLDSLKALQAFWEQATELNEEEEKPGLCKVTSAPEDLGLREGAEMIHFEYEGYRVFLPLPKTLKQPESPSGDFRKS